MQATRNSTESEGLAGDNKKLLRRVCLLGMLLIASFVAIYFLSPPFEYGSDLVRPTLAVTGILMLSSVFAFFALTNATKVSTTNQRSQRQLLFLILGIALSARLIALFTCPILEIDYYRYIWDGRVTAAGISPYRFAPAQVLEAPLDAEGELSDLSSLAARSESNQTILSRIHFENHTTLYPPISQVVFCGSVLAVPESASVKTQVTSMKFVLLLFDVATLVLVLCLLQTLNRHVGWLIVYAWNPLVIKEIANGGHLDSIATLFTVLSVFLFVRWHRTDLARHRLAATSAFALGLGVGAKLFPVVIFPVLFVSMFRKCKLASCVFSIIFFLVAGVCLWPIFSSLADRHHIQNSGRTDGSERPAEVAAADFKEGESNHAGLTAFFSKWQMNDVVFSSVYLNLKDVQPDAAQPPWYVFTSSKFRSRFCQWWKKHGLGTHAPARSAARVFTMGLFSIFYFYQLAMVGRRKNGNEQSMTQLVGRIGLIIVAFLFFQPTVNPWYLLWALPFCSFSNNRGWLLVSGTILIYYSRFWFESLPGSFEIGGTAYSGAGLFDHFVTWGEHLTIAAILLSFFVHERWSGSRSASD